MKHVLVTLGNTTWQLLSEGVHAALVEHFVIQIDASFETRRALVSRLATLSCSCYMKRYFLHLHSTVAQQPALCLQAANTFCNMLVAFGRIR